MLVEVSPAAYRQYLRTVASKSTASRYEYGAKLLLEYCRIVGRDIRTAPPGLLQSYVAWLTTERKLGPATIKVIHSGSTKYLEWRRKMGDPIPALHRPDLPQIPTRQPERLTQEQLARYLRSVTEKVPEPTRMALVLLGYCGLRSAEHVRLSLADVRVDMVDGRRRVTLRVVGKGTKFRYVPVLEPVYPRLIAYLSGWRAQQVESPWLFPSLRGRGHMSDSTLRDHLVEVRRHANLPPSVTPHTLRRTYASALRQMGYSEVTIADILGHESVDTTRKHYFAIASPTELWQRLNAQPHHQQER